MNSIDFTNIHLYLHKKCLVTLITAETVEGILEDVTQELLFIDQTSISMNCVTDIEHVGTITYCDISNEEGYLGKYFFSTKSLTNVLDIGSLSNHEIYYHAACHLSIEKNEIVATDLRVLEKKHSYNVDTLMDNEFVFITNDESIAGKILYEEDGNAFVKDSKGVVHPICLSSVNDIYLAPDINSHISVIISGSSTPIEGIVSYCSSYYFSLISDASLVNIYYSDVYQIRYYSNLIIQRERVKGTITNRYFVDIDGHICEFQEKSCHSTRDKKHLINNVLISYITGICENGLIIKDISVEENISNHKIKHQNIGILTSIKNGVGHISNHYVSTAYKSLLNTGSIYDTMQFKVGALDFKPDIFNKYIYIVKYIYLTSQNDDPETVYLADYVQYVDALPFETTGTIDIDKNGNVISKNLDIAIIPYYKNRAIEILLRDSVVKRGIVKDYSQNHITLCSGFHEREKTENISLADIARIRQIGVITSISYPSQTSGFIGPFFFHNSFFRTKEDVDNASEGALVSFSIMNTLKGNGYVAKDITTIKETIEYGYLLNYNGDFFTIRSKDSQKRNAERKYRPYGMRKEKLIAIKRNIKKYRGSSIKYYIRRLGPSYNIYLIDIDPSKKEKRKQSTPQKKEPLHSKELLQSYLLKDMVIDIDYKYGIISYSSPSYTLINNMYINTHFNSGGKYNTKAIIFHRENAKIEGMESRFQTTTYSYLVLFKEAPLEIDEDQSSVYLSTESFEYNDAFLYPQRITMKSDSISSETIDYRYPVIVLAKFKKKNYARLTVNGDFLEIEGSGSFLPTVFDAPSFIPGEDIIVIKSRNYYFLPCVMDLNELYKEYGNDITVYRFGLITGLNMTDGYGSLNGAIKFSLSSIDSKTLNILNAANAANQLLVVYSIDSNQISEVKKLNDAVLSTIPWKRGVVTSIFNDERKAIIDNRSTYHFTVLSDGLISKYFRENELLNKEVYIRTINHPWFSEKIDAYSTHSSIGTTTEIKSAVADIHGVEEMAKIQYDQVRGTYLGYRNMTYFFPIVSNRLKRLSELEGQEAPIMFEIDINSNTLVATLSDEYDEDSEDNTLFYEDEDVEEDYSINNLLSEKIVNLLLSEINLKSFIRHDYNMRKNGEPIDMESAQTVIDNLPYSSNYLCLIIAAKILNQFPDIKLSKRTKYFIKYRRSPNLPGKLVRRAIYFRCRDIERDPNAVFGELAFFLTLMTYYENRYIDNERKHTSKEAYLYQLFSIDFSSRQEILKFANHKLTVSAGDLNRLFEEAHAHVKIQDFLAHILPLDMSCYDIVLPLIKDNEVLVRGLIDYTYAIDTAIVRNSIETILTILKDYYKSDKRRFQSRFASLIESENVFKSTVDIIRDMNEKYLKMICIDDSEYFRDLLQICLSVIDYSQKNGFENQDQALRNAYNDLLELKKAIISHPTREISEMLFVNGKNDTHFLINHLLGEIEKTINKIYDNSETIPQVHCYLEDANVILTEEEKQNNYANINLIVYISDAYNNNNPYDLKPARDVKLSFQSLTEGVDITREIIVNNTLTPGMQKFIILKIDFSSLGHSPKESISFEWTSEYYYYSHFSNGKPELTKGRTDCRKPLKIQIAEDSFFVKNYDVANPYEIPAKGVALDDSYMFFGRDDEKRDIINTFIRESELGAEFIPGSTTIIYGQKQCGKTSLINQIINDIKNTPYLNKSAIIIRFTNILSDAGGISGLGNFMNTFYGLIFSKLRTELHKNHRELEKELLSKGVIIPSITEIKNIEQYLLPVLFEDYFSHFQAVDKGRHVIILVMDEFSVFCTSILKEVQSGANKALETLPNFVKSFSRKGFIQIIIGHESMLRALTTLGNLNHTGQFSNKIEVTALKEEDARKLITIPMTNAFGYEVYSGTLGESAIDILLDMSGCSPLFLVKLCNQVFLYYTDKNRCNQQKLTLYDIENVIDDFLTRINPNFFDVLLIEDGDSVDLLEDRMTYKYLKCAAQQVYQYDDRTSDISLIKSNLESIYGIDQEEIDKTQNLLLDRRVISLQRGGRVRINVGLFVRFILKLQGK